MKNYSFNTILSSDFIGNSLSAINQNYFNLNQWVNDVGSFYNNVIPILNFYNENISSIKDTLLLTNNNSNDWMSFITNVQTNSSKWIIPISITYPTIFPYNSYYVNNNLLTDVGNWLTSNVPIIDGNGILKYIEGQKLIVNCYSYEEEVKIDATNTLIDYTICSTYDQQICAHCSTTSFGNDVHCHQGSFGCSGSFSCLNCATIGCSYVVEPHSGRDRRSVPYIPLEQSFLSTDSYIFIDTTSTPRNQPPNKDIYVADTEIPQSHYAKGQIQADATMYFKDRWEHIQIYTLMFKIKNCSWVFEKYITA